ncbi:MAG: biotin/lipoyl-binding protein [Muribaculaceae bacterium]|mgnify:FL=1|nr:biotin/lipoyl-binding protein [Muribaculaceae bacterium]
MKEYKYKINGNAYTVTVGEIEGNFAQVEVNGVPYKVELQNEVKAPTVAKPKTSAAPRTSGGEKVVSKPAASTGSASAVKSPLPGVVVDIKVSVGDAVKAGNVVAVLEAMKMENDICAPKDGVVKQIVVSKGDSVLEGTDLIVIE